LREDIFFGLEIRPAFKGRVEIPLHHSFICSITGAGKSVTARTLISRVNAKFLIIDCKTPRDYEGLGPDVPIFIDQKSEPLMIKRLLESSSRLWLRKEFPELIELCKVGNTWEGVLEATRQKMRWKHPKTGRGVHPVVKERLLVLEHLLGKLIKEMKNIEIVDTLQLPYRINVIDIHGLSLGLQQLIVHSVLTEILNKHSNVVVVLDEAHRFIPERKPSAARDAVTTLIKEGRAKGDFLWMSDQTITGVDKDVLKQMHVWILGCQTELNEANRILDQLTHDLGLKRRDIYQLKTGHFLVNTREWTKLAYLVPEGMSLDLAEKVITGQIKPEEAFKQIEGKEVETDVVWKEKYEEEHRIRKELEKRLAEYSEELNKRVKAVKEVKELHEKIDFLETKNKDLTKRLENTEKELRLYDEFKSVLRRMFKGTALVEFQPTVELEHKELVVNLHHAGEREIKMSTNNKEGQILFCALNDLPKEGWTYSEMNKALMERGWPIKSSTLAAKLSILTGRSILVKTSKGYRLPTKVEFNVVKT